MADAVAIEKGFILSYRIYEVGDEIDLFRAEALVKRDATRMKLSREGSQYLEFPNPPLTVSLGSRPLALTAGVTSAETKARVFDHGAVSITLRVALPSSLPWTDLVALADEVYDSAAADRLARAEVEALQKALLPAIEDPHLWDSFETYTIVFAEAMRGAGTAAEILARADLAQLLLGETAPKPLSVRERHDVTKHAFSYLEDDLAVIDWNSAFVYEPSGSLDIPDVLEVANAQLLEMRYFDWLLDRELARIYDEVGIARVSVLKRLFRSPYGALARQVMALLLELTEFTERVENSLKVVGDFYLARVYADALKRLRVPDWQSSVYRKLSLVERVYTLLKGEVDTRRSQLLEVAIVVLIVVEIALALGLVPK